MVVALMDGVESPCEHPGAVTEVLCWSARAYTDDAVFAAATHHAPYLVQ